jgi:Transmembrane secretion effector
VPELLVVLLATGAVQSWMVVTLSLVVGDAVSMPSFQATVPSIVTREQIPSALALNATQFNLSRILEPGRAQAIALNRLRKINARRWVSAPECLRARSRRDGGV